jgi:hypothetical protein
MPPAASGTAQVCEATPQVQWFASWLIIFHFSALLIALSANMAPSFLQGEMTSWLAPYSVTTGQSYGAIPLELTHAEPIDFPLLVELHRPQDDPQTWQTADLPYARVSRSGDVNLRGSRWPNVSRLIRMSAIDDPESEILSDIAAQAVKAMQRGRQEEFDRVRFLAPKVLSFDEDAIVAAGQGSLISGELSPEIVFSAWIVRDSDEGIKLIPQQDAARTSKPVKSEIRP